MESFSQFGQDRFVDEHVFRGMRGGFFVDIGAHDGVSFSNSVLLERQRGWTGVCVEPMPQRFAELRANRRCHCINACITPVPGPQQFTMVTGTADMLSGVSSALGEDHRRRIEVELREKGGSQQVIEVQGIPFNDLVTSVGAGRIDFCSIDTEGMEFDILRSIDFSRYGAGCYCIEENGRFLELRRFLRPRGYRPVEKLGSDLIFVHESRIASMPRVGFLKPGTLALRAAKAVARRVLRTICPTRRRPSRGFTTCGW